jgi:GntR family transcriptional regulator
MSTSGLADVDTPSGGTLATVTEHDWRPRYVQLAASLRSDILSGVLKPGDSLPSEPELAESWGLSRTSVRHAIRELREWGLVRAEQGRGTFVRSARQRVRRDHSQRYQWEKDRVRLGEAERGATGATEFDTGLSLSDLEFRAKYSSIPAPESLAKRFGVSAGTILLQREYWTGTRAEKVPLNLVRSYLVRTIAEANPRLLDESNEPWPGGTQNQLHTLGIEVDRVVDEITARPPYPDEAQSLDIEPGVSVLVLWKTSVDTGGSVVEVSEVVMPGDRTEIAYTTELSRWDQ